jgi:TusA-related sulfurtransferase
MATPETETPWPEADAVLEMMAREGATCSLLTPAIKAKLRQMSKGQVLEVRVNDPSAREDLASWSRLTGNTLLATRANGDGLRAAIRKEND